MWIRSQSKETLTNAKDLYIRTISKGYQICSDRVNLGTYSTKEKALKVLDVIQNCIAFNENIVFEMPQDGDVNEKEI